MITSQGIRRSERRISFFPEQKLILLLLVPIVTGIVITRTARSPTQTHASITPTVEESVSRIPASEHPALALTTQAADTPLKALRTASLSIQTAVAIEEEVGTVSKPRPETEKGYYLSYSDMARHDPGKFREQMVNVLLGDSLLIEKIALLRAAYDTRIDTDLEAFRVALTEARSGPELRSFACRYLSRKAPFDFRVLTVLESYVQSPSSGEDRSRALSTLFAYGDDAVITRCMNVLYAEKDPQQVEGAVRALMGKETLMARSLVHQLAWGHSDESVRQRVNEILTGDFRNTQEGEEGNPE